MTFATAIRQDKKAGQHVRRARTSAARATLAERERDVRKALTTPLAVRAASDGLLDACRHGADERTLDHRQADLWYAAEAVGHPWDRLFRLMRGVLADSKADISEAEREISAGMIRVLPRPPEHGPNGMDDRSAPRAPRALSPARRRGDGQRGLGRRRGRLFRRVQGRGRSRHVLARPAAARRVGRRGNARNSRDRAAPRRAVRLAVGTA